MELVGASWEFISRPYLLRSVWHGLLSGLLAVGGLTLVVLGMHSLLPELGNLNDWLTFALLAAALILVGIFISTVSTWFVVNKYLKMRVGDLY